jgi:CxxC-x17-CxxC domain-containing protein
MTDEDTKPVEEPVAEESKTEETPVEPAVEEPAAETPASNPAPTGAAAPVGTDQQGRQLYEVKCSDCGKLTQVPFNPTGDRPVYCRDCYMKRKG